MHPRVTNFCKFLQSCTDQPHWNIKFKKKTSKYFKMYLKPILTYLKIKGIFTKAITCYSSSYAYNLISIVSIVTPPPSSIIGFNLHIFIIILVGVKKLCEFRFPLRTCNMISRTVRPASRTCNKSTKYPLDELQN